MRLMVIGGCGVWPAAGQACSGYLLEHDGFRLLIDPGYATLPLLLTEISADDVDAVLVSHGHPDHCADLNPLLRARTLRDDPPPALPVHALPGALDAVLALDRPGMLAGSYQLRPIVPGASFDVGPFRVDPRQLPHSAPNVGVRITAGRHVMAYTGDTGETDDIAALARGADVLLAEATFVDRVPEESRGTLSSARGAGTQAAAAGAGELVLTHLPPGEDATAAQAAAADDFRGNINVAAPGLVLELP